MKREKELAERRKNEPKLDQNQDHLVRKIFSRFRKGGSNSSSNLLSSSTSAPSSAHAAGGVSNGPCGSQGGTPSHHGSRDVERGELFQQLSGEDSGGSPRRERVLNMGKSNDESSGSGSRTGSAKSKWGRMIRGTSGSVEVATESGDPQSMQSLLPNKSNSSGSNPQQPTSGSQQNNNKEPRAGSGGSGNRVYPKLSRVPERQETQEDPPHHHPVSRINRVGPQVIDFHTVGQIERTDDSPAGGSGGHNNIIESFAELKHEVRSEVQRINHKMTRLEDILGEILVRLTPPTAPTPRSGRSSSRGASGGGNITQVTPAPAPAVTGNVIPPDTSSSPSPFLVVTSASLVDEASSSSPSGRKPQGSRSRPRSGGQDGSSKLVTQFQEYV